MSILSERRALQPYGLLGGNPGSRGLNLLKFKTDNRIINLGGKNTITVNNGDTLTVLSPGGGGYGDPSEGTLGIVDDEHVTSPLVMFKTSGSLNQYTLTQESV